MSWKDIVKEDIKKMADITWELDGRMLSVFLENPPDDKKAHTLKMQLDM